MLNPKRKIYVAKLAIKRGIEYAANYYMDSIYVSSSKFEQKRSSVLKNVRRKIRQWIKIYNSGNMNEFEMKKSKKTGRPKKPTPLKEIWEKLTEEQRYAIFKRKMEQDREKSKKEKMEEQDKFDALIPQSTRASLWSLSREGIRKFNKRGKEYLCNTKEHKYKNEILSIATDHAEVVNNELHYRKGRRYIANELKTLYSIVISPRMVGNYMARLGVQADVRRKGRAFKIKESKNTLVDIPNLLNQNYDRPMTVTVDVKFIEHKHKDGNHIFLEFINDIESKEIIAWDLDYHQGVDQTMRNLEKLDYTKIDMLASDHGSQYVSHVVQKFLKDNNVVQSCSRVGVSLDNRPSEHLFGIAQTECFNFHNMSSYSFEKIKEVIENFVKYYNSKRKQEKLGWLTPEAFRSQNPSLSANF